MQCARPLSQRRIPPLQFGLAQDFGENEDLLHAISRFRGAERDDQDRRKIAMDLFGCQLVGNVIGECDLSQFQASFDLQAEFAVCQNM
jgi:hypothetical protein